MEYEPLVSLENGNAQSCLIKLQSFLCLDNDAWLIGSKTKFVVCSCHAVLQHCWQTNDWKAQLRSQDLKCSSRHRDGPTLGRAGLPGFWASRGRTSQRLNASIAASALSLTRSWRPRRTSVHPLRLPRRYELAKHSRFAGRSRVRAPAESGPLSHAQPCRKRDGGLA